MALPGCTNYSVKTDPQVKLNYWCEKHTVYITWQHNPYIVFLCCTYHPNHFRLCCCLQEMLAIMKSIYDMMGRYTYPCVRDEAPYEHVDKFFQVKTAWKGNKRQMFCFVLLIPMLFPSENGQKPGRRRDHRRVHWDLSEGLCFYNLLPYRLTDFIYLSYTLYEVI